MNVLINYANAAYRKSQRLNSKTAIEVGGFDKVISYGPRDIDSSFYQKNRHILSQWRGNGYWLWKSYFIKKSLELLTNNDFLFYCDSGSYFINSINSLIDSCQYAGQGMIPFELQHVEKYWTKRDTFILMNCDQPEYTKSKQRLASFSLWRKTASTLDFVTDWLTYGQDARIITDLQNQMGHPNYPGYRDHRHDQSIFSLLSKQYQLEAYRDPSQWGNEVVVDYPHSTYPQLINLTRKRQFLTDFRHVPKLIAATPILWKLAQVGLKQVYTRKRDAGQLEH